MHAASRHSGKFPKKRTPKITSVHDLHERCAESTDLSRLAPAPHAFWRMYVDLMHLTYTDCKQQMNTRTPLILYSCTIYHDIHSLFYERMLVSTHKNRQNTHTPPTHTRISRHKHTHTLPSREKNSESCSRACHTPPKLTQTVP